MNILIYKRVHIINMMSMISTIEYMETLDYDEDDTSYKTMMDMKKEMKDNLFKLLCSEYKENYKKKQEEKNKKKEDKEKYMKLQRERESEGEVCPRCSRRDCCC